jgi:hypothetical protein
MILSAMHDFSVIQQIEQLPTVNLIERYIETEIWVGLEQAANVEGC